LITSQAVHAILPSERDDSRFAELLRRACGGDADAFASVTDILAPRMWAIARAVTCNPELAEAVAVNAFESVWRGAPGCPQDPAVAMAWAMGVAVRRSVKAVTTGAGQPRMSWHARAPHGDDGVRMALFALPAVQRDAILLSRYGRLSLGDVAWALEVPRHEAAALLRDALLRLGRLPHDRRFPSLVRGA